MLTNRHFFTTLFASRCDTKCITQQHKVTHLVTESASLGNGKCVTWQHKLTQKQTLRLKSKGLVT